MTTPDVSTAPARLSPEEVAAMSDEDLSARVVRVCLGREVLEARYGESAAFTCWRRGATVWWRPSVRCDPVKFSPSNPVAVEHVREHMRERGCEWQLESIGRERWSARILPPGFSVARHAITVSFGRAVFQAALLAAQEIKPPVSP